MKLCGSTCFRKRELLLYVDYAVAFGKADLSRVWQRLAWVILPVFSDKDSSNVREGFHITPSLACCA